MDGETAVWQLLNMYQNPQAVFRWIRAHRHTKGAWSRDDPGFLILETLIITVVAIFWYIMPFTPYSLRCLIKSLLSFLVIDFFLQGVILASATYVSLTKWGKAQNIPSHFSDEAIEWKFCFDCFANSFVAIIVDIDISFIIVLIIRKVMSHLKKAYFARIFLPNFLIFIALTHFTILFIQCLQVMPFIKRMNYLIFCVPIFILFMISIAFSIPLFDLWFKCHF